MWTERYHHGPMYSVLGKPRQWSLEIGDSRITEQFYPLEQNSEPWQQHSSVISSMGINTERKEADGSMKVFVESFDSDSFAGVDPSGSNQLVSDSPPIISNSLNSSFHTTSNSLNSVKPFFKAFRKFNPLRLLRSKKYWEARQVMRSGLVSSILGSETGDKRPYANILVNDVPYRGLLDSGATVSVLGCGSEKLLNDNKYKIHKFPSSIQTASGQKQAVIGFLYAQVQFNAQSHSMRFYLVPSLEQSLYLGIDFWNQFGISPQISSLSDITNSLDLPVSPKFHLLSPEDNIKLSTIVNKFPSNVKLGLGKTTLVSHVIDVGEAKPVKQRFYSVSPAKQKLMYDELDRMLSLDVIEESHSSWCSPITLVHKANGQVRLCLDAREVNKVTVRDAYPLPLINGLLGRLDQTHYISSIDLKDAFWQIPLDPQSRDKTAFTVPGRPLYHFKVMPFGLCNAPQTLCRLMHRVIPYQLHDKVFVYLDDLLVTSSTLSEHFELLELIARLLRNAGLTINVEKSQFVLKEVKYLGYLVGDGCLRTNPEKCKAINDFPRPKTTKQIRSFLGLCGWYRRFIQNFASLAAPLSDLTGKKSKSKWNLHAEESFQALKLALSSAPVLANPDYGRPFYIQCDASAVGVGSVLFQLDSDDAEHPIEFFSYKLNAAQRNYSVTELECFAAVLSVKKFRPYIEGYPFTIYTDHASLRWLMSQKDLSGRLARWSLKLQAYKFDIGYRKGSVNIVPDALSRAILTEPTDALNPEQNPLITLTTTNNDSTNFVNSSVNLENVSSLKSSNDNSVLHIDLNSSAFQDDEYVQQINRVLQLKDCEHNFKIRDNKLLILPSYASRYTSTDLPEWKLVVPLSLTAHLIELAHSSPTSAHMGIKKTVERLQRQFFWFGMTKQTKLFISNCLQCKMNKPVNFTTQPLMGSQTESIRPFEKLFVDFLGPYPRSKRGNTCIAIVLDHYSKFVLVKPLREASAASLCNFLENEVFLLFSVPAVITSDNGKQFISHLFKDLLKKYNVEHRRTPIYSPQSNASERVNRTLLSSMRSYLNDHNHSEWDCHLSEIAAALRNVKHDVTNFSPHYLVFGQHMSLNGSDYALRKLLSPQDDNELHVLSKSNRLNLIRDQITHYLKVAHEKSANRYNLRSKTRNFLPNQPVFVRSFVQSSASDRFSAKLSAKFIPALITDKVGSVSYHVRNLDGKPLGVYHAKDIRI